MCILQYASSLRPGMWRGEGGGEADVRAGLDCRCLHIIITYLTFLNILVHCERRGPRPHSVGNHAGLGQCGSSINCLYRVSKLIRSMDIHVLFMFKTQFMLFCITSSTFYIYWFHLLLLYILQQCVKHIYECFLRIICWLSKHGSNTRLHKISRKNTNEMRVSQI